MDEFAAGPVFERPVYRDADHVVFWNGSYYVVHEIRTHRRRSYFDVRDAFQDLNHAGTAPVTA